ncbi:MAG: hypothetical protein BWY10_02599 [Chloroflexi bacterium ADurb.Bin180]|nr:MAG: hypothetical protein BWY10_02599 [Chloroflexi bacterium ADurb.Bin180]
MLDEDVAVGGVEGEGKYRRADQDEEHEDRQLGGVLQRLPEQAEAQAAESAALAQQAADLAQQQIQMQQQQAVWEAVLRMQAQFDAAEDARQAEWEVDRLRRHQERMEGIERHQAELQQERERARILRELMKRDPPDFGL